MKWAETLGEFLVGLVILVITLLCIVVAAFVSLFEFPKYWRLSHK
jgi:hypothetical protein